MIAKKIPKDPEIPDSFKALANYIAEAREVGEKLENLWIGNCNAGTDLEDLSAAIAEVEATRALKPHVANKTYHLVVSFRPGEEPDDTAVKGIEEAFTAALGFEEHQWVSGTHRNTDNFHLHIAYNRVHPKTLKVYSPWDDYRNLERTCREMEKKFGFQADLGMSDYDERSGPSEKAKDYEAHTWQQSFQSYVIEHKEEILAIVERSRNWQGLHKGLAALDLELKPRGNGLVFKRRDGKEAAKASLVDRSLSAAALKKRFGPFEALNKPLKAKPRHRYEAKPLTHHPATSRLWRVYQNRRRLSPRTLTERIAANWKQFLLNEAYHDPLGLVVIMMHKEMLNGIFGAGVGRQVPKLCRPALRHWMKNAKMESPSDSDNSNQVIPFRDKNSQIWALWITNADGQTLTLGETARPGILCLIDTDNHKNGPNKTIITDNHNEVATITASGASAAIIPQGGDLKAVIEALHGLRQPGEITVAGGSELVGQAEGLKISTIWSR
jgi:hypothetical protein